MAYFNKTSPIKGWNINFNPPTNGQESPEEERGFNPTELSGDFDLMDCKEDRVYATYNYDRFTLDSTNRPVNRGHVEKLKQSYNKKDLRTVIDVSIDGVVIDGQHRHTMCKETDRKLLFRVKYGETIADVQLLNSTTKKWTLSDYAVYHEAEEQRKMERDVRKGIPVVPGPYTLIGQVVKTYGLNHQQLLFILNPTALNGRPADFKDGKFELTVEGKEDLVRKVQNLKELLAFYKRAFTRHFSMTYSQALNNPKFKHRAFLRRLKQGHTIWDKLSVLDHKAQVEKIYNHGLKEINRIKL